MTMDLLVKIIGGLIIAMGVVFVMWPKSMEQTVRFFAVGRRIYVVAVVRIVLGVILLLASKGWAARPLLVVLGILVLAAGIIMLVLKQERLQRLLLWWAAQPIWAKRLGGAAAVIFGSLIIAGTLQ